MAVRLDEWIRAWYKAHPGEKISAEQADQIFVGLCRLLQKEFPAIAASPEAEALMPGLCPACFWMEENQPASIRPIAGSIDYCPAEDPVDEATCLFGMGLILYELLTGSIYADKFDYHVGISDFYWDYLKEEAAKNGWESLADTAGLPSEYRELAEIFSELTQFDREARPASLLAGEIPACEYEWRAVNEANGQIISRKTGLLGGIDTTEKLPSALEKDGRHYEAVGGQRMEISYSFLKKNYEIRYREMSAHGSAAGGSAAHGSAAGGSAVRGSAAGGSAVRGSAAGGNAVHGSAIGGSAAGRTGSGEKSASTSASWEESDLGLLVNDGAGGRSFAPLILWEKRDVRYRMRPECPIGYSSWREVPSLLLTVMRRRKGCGAITQIAERPDAFREECSFTLELKYPGRMTAHPELELTEKKDGGFKIRCEWVSADGRKVGAASEVGD
ncbi:MAG: hypothetical protein LUG93_14760 [Lachnospiraceae bacterium]|nr:hypothetical protein [Lachnospiraceae bacterium]